MPLRTTERLFSYGTLQLTPVQLETFGRPLEGSPDALIGWQQDWVKITDPEVLRKSGEAMHPILRYTGTPMQMVLGTVFEISKYELQCADEYEVSDYERVKADLKSGGKAWVYVEKGSGPPVS